MLAVSVVVPPLLIATVWFRRRSDRAYGRARESIATVNANFQENLSGVRVAQAYVREDRNIGSFRAVGREYLGHRLDAQRLVAVYFPFVLFLAGIADAIVLGVGSRASGRPDHRGGHAHRVPALPRPVLLAHPAALAGVRHLAAGAGLDGEDQRAHGDPVGHARAGPSGRPRPGLRCRPFRGRPLPLPNRGRRGAARGRPRGRAGRDGRAGRRDGGREVDDREARRPLLRRDRAGAC